MWGGFFLRAVALLALYLLAAIFVLLSARRIRREQERTGRGKRRRGEVSPVHVVCAFLAMPVVLLYWAITSLGDAVFGEDDDTLEFRQDVEATADHAWNDEGKKPAHSERGVIV